MVIRQLEAKRFTYFQNQLIQQAQQNPLDASFNVTIIVNAREYILKVQLDTKCRVAALQAWEVERENNLGQAHTLITNNQILASLLNLLLLQGIEQ